ncbi:hypothetical protein ACFL0C_01150 [Patescibacteria group bacterium]
MAGKPLEVELQKHNRDYVFVVTGRKSKQPRFVKKDGTLSVYCNVDDLLTHNRSEGGNNILGGAGLRDKYVMKTA